MSRTERLIAFPSKGQVTEIEKVAVPTDAYHFGVNVRVDNLCLRQRHGTREIPLEVDTRVENNTLDIEEVQKLNFQSAVYYSPSTGSSAIQFSDKGSSLVLAAAGRKFLVRLVGNKWNTKGLVSEITTIAQPSDLYEVYMKQAENYLISGDDQSETWIYDGNTARLSNGYNTVNRPDSEVPHGTRLINYAHNRLVTVVGDREIYVGDIIHGEDTTDPLDVIDFTEQTYWAEGQRFVLPTEAGRILSMYSLPVLGDNTRHGDLIIEAEYQTWALDLGVYPRENWANTQMLTLVSLEGGSQGQHSYDTYNNDALRRTQSGIETLSFTNQSGDNIKAPQKNISYPIYSWLNKDDEGSLKYSSLKMHRKAQRFYCTVRPFSNTRNWGSRGWVSYNYKDKAWDGLWTPPYWAEDIKMFLRYPQRGAERMLMIAGGAGKNIRLLEICETYMHDWDENGDPQSIESIVDTRSLFKDLNERIKPEKAAIQFSDVKGDFFYKIQWKSASSGGCWNDWMSERLECDHSNPRLITRTIEEFSGSKLNGARINEDVEYQFRIAWEGNACLRYFDIETDTGDDQFNRKENLDITCSLYNNTCCEDYFRYSQNT